MWSVPKRDALLRSLQPTRCHEYPPVFRLPGMVLAHFRSRLHASPSHTRACVCRTRRDPRRRRASVAGRHRPQVALRLGAAVTSYVPIRPPDDEVACACADKRPERACSATREPDGWAADVPCRTAARPTRGRDGATAPRTNPLAVRQHRAVVSPERLPSINPRSARRLIQPTSSSEPPLLLWLRRRCAASNTRSRTRCVR